MNPKPDPDKLGPKAGRNWYEVGWSITGVRRVLARSAEEAEDLVAPTLNLRDCAEEGELETYPAKLLERV